MAALFSTTFWFIATIIAWKLWKRTVRDVVRDSLFDVRDAWRIYWVKSGRDLSDPAYGTFRSEINCYLRYTSTYRFSDLLYVSRNRKRVQEAIEKCSVSEIHGDDEVMSEMAKLRKQAIASLQAYMVSTSVLVFPVFFVAFIAMFAKRLSLIASYFKTTVRLANFVSIGRPETIMQAARVKPLAS